MKLQIFIFGIAFINLLIILEFLRKRKLSEHFAILWLGVGFAGIIMAAMRPLVDSLSNDLGIKYGPSLVFTGAILFLVILAMYFSLRISKLENQVEKLAEHIAAKDLENEEHV